MRGAAVLLMMGLLAVSCGDGEKPDVVPRQQTTPEPTVTPTPTATPESTAPPQSRTVDGSGDAEVTACVPNEVVLGHKTDITVTVTNRGDAPRDYNVYVGVFDAEGNELDRENERFLAVASGETRTDEFAIRTAFEPSGCKIVEVRAVEYD